MRFVDLSAPIASSPPETLDAWGWDGPLHFQAEAAKRENRPGIFWAAHQADLPYSQIERLCNLGELPARASPSPAFRCASSAPRLRRRGWSRCSTSSGPLRISPDGAPSPPFYT